MIVNIRGTSGSGKSYLVRKVMELYDQRMPVRGKVPGKDGEPRDRKQPIGYLCTRKGGGRSLYVLGHYETACGGCDTLPTLDYVYDSVLRAAKEGHDVLYEGVIVTSDVRRCIELQTIHNLDLLVVGMDVPLDLCVESINIRRRARGVEEPVDPVNTASKHKTNVVGMRKLQEAKVNAQWLNRDDALTKIITALALPFDKNDHQCERCQDDAPGTCELLEMP